MALNFSGRLISLRNLLIPVCFCYSVYNSFSQHVSRNITGDWESQASWDPDWINPVRDSINVDITINGNITASGSVSFAYAPTTLTVDGTLVINGDLFLGNKNNLTITDNGILIIKGNLTISNKSVIISNRYLVVAGNLIKSGSLIQGSAASNDNPVKVFITGSVSANISDNALYPIFDTEPPFSTAAYPGSGDCFGNMTDLMNDPVWSSYVATCKVKNASVNGPLCPGQTLLLHAEGGNSYEWSGPRGFTSNLQDPSIPDIAGINAGTYSVKISESFCPEETKPLILTVNEAPIAGITCPDKVCKGQEIKLESSGGIAYHWTGPGGFESDLQKPLIPAAGEGMSGSYSVKVTGANTCSATVAHELTVVSLPAAGASSNAPLCSGNNLKLFSQGGTAYRWTGPCEFSASVQNPVIENAGPLYSGNYTVIVTDENNCSSSASLAVQVFDLPRPVISSNSPVCKGETILLSCTGGTSFKWKGPADFSSDIANPAISGADQPKAGTYEVTVTDENSCSAKASVQMVINPLPEVNFSTSVDRICAGENLELTGSPAGGIFSLKSGPGSISGTSYTSDSPGSAVLEYTYSQGCSNRTSKTVEVIRRPVPFAGSDQLLKYVFETDMQAELSPGMQGRWSCVSGSALFEDDTSPVTKISRLEVGENVLNWTVNNGYCEESSEVKIIVEDLFVPSVITPNNDGKNDQFLINEQWAGMKLTIFDRWGNIEFSSNDYHNDWDGKNPAGNELPEDTYFYILDMGNGIKRKGSVTIIR